MRLLALLICIPILMGNTSTLNIHSKAMDFIKKNEGYRTKSYPDDNKKTKRIEYAICWGNHFLENDKRIKHVSNFTKTRCNKIFYTHFYKRVLPKIKKNIKGKEFILHADLAWQFGSVRLDRINWYPERGRGKLLYRKQGKVDNTK